MHQQFNDLAILGRHVSEAADQMTALAELRSNTPKGTEAAALVEQNLRLAVHGYSLYLLKVLHQIDAIVKVLLAEQVKVSALLEEVSDGSSGDDDR